MVPWTDVIREQLIYFKAVDRSCELNGNLSDRNRNNIDGDNCALCLMKTMFFCAYYFIANISYELKGKTNVVGLIPDRL